MKTSRLSYLCLFLAVLFFSVQSSFGQCDPDTEFPVAVCYSNVNIALPASGTLNLDPGFFDAGSHDNCTTEENLEFSVSPLSVSCADIGTPVMVYLYVTDEAGNTNVCWSEATIEDKTGPLLICIADINISLPASGSLTLTPEMILDFSDDNCELTFDISPPVVTCADIGDPIIVNITATDPGGNSNVCSASVTVEDKTGPLLICNELINVALEAGGTLTLTPEMILDVYEDNCELTFTITPSEVTCADKGDTVPVTIEATDPGGNSNICSGNVFVQDPRPDDVEILGPEDIICESSGIVFNSTVTGGAGPFVYEWVIKKGASDGWVITSGQGTPSITMDAGIKKLKLELTVFDVCGKKRKDSYKKTCVAPPSGLVDNGNSSFAIGAPTSADEHTNTSNILIYPNPASNQLVLTIAQDYESIRKIQIYNNMGAQVVVSNQTGNTDQSRILNIEYLPAGIYTLILYIEGEKPMVKRFVKQ